MQRHVLAGTVEDCLCPILPGNASSVASLLSSPNGLVKSRACGPVGSSQRKSKSHINSIAVQVGERTGHPNPAPSLTLPSHSILHTTNFTVDKSWCILVAAEFAQKHLITTPKFPSY